MTSRHVSKKIQLTWKNAKITVSKFLKSPLITACIQSATGGYVFTGMCLSTKGEGVLPCLWCLILSRGYPVDSGPFLGVAGGGGTPIRPIAQGGTPGQDSGYPRQGVPPPDPSMVDRLRRGWYASCGHAGGLSYWNVWQPYTVINRSLHLCKKFAVLKRYIFRKHEGPKILYNIQLPATTSGFGLCAKISCRFQCHHRNWVFFDVLKKKTN